MVDPPMERVVENNDVGEVRMNGTTQELQRLYDKSMMEGLFVVPSWERDPLEERMRKTTALMARKELKMRGCKRRGLRWLGGEKVDEFAELKEQFLWLRKELRCMRRSQES